MEKLFGYEEARRVYRTFCKFDVHEGIETSILSIARLDSIMASIIASCVEEQVTEPAPTCTQHNETSHSERMGVIYENIVTKPKVKWRPKGGRTLMDDIRKLKAYFPQSIF